MTGVSPCGRHAPPTSRGGGGGTASSTPPAQPRELMWCHAVVPGVLMHEADHLVMG